MAQSVAKFCHPTCTRILPAPQLQEMLPLETEGKQRLGEFTRETNGR